MSTRGKIGLATLKDVTGATIAPVLPSLIPSFGNGKNDIVELTRLTGKAPSELSSSVSTPCLAKIANLYLVKNYPYGHGSKGKSKMKLLDDMGYYNADKQKKKDWTLPKKNTPFSHFLDHGGDIFEGIFISGKDKSLYTDQLKTFLAKGGRGPSEIIGFLIPFLQEKIDEMATDEKDEYLQWDRRMSWESVGEDFTLSPGITIESISQFTPTWEGETRTGPLLPEDQDVCNTLVPLFINGVLPSDVKPGTPLTHVLSLLLHREVNNVSARFSNVTNVVYNPTPTDEVDDESATDYLPLIKALIRLCARNVFIVRGGYKRTEEAKQSATYKEGKAKSADTKKAAKNDLVDAESEAYEGAVEELFTSLGIDYSDGKLTKDGVGKCDIEDEAMGIAITLSHNGALPSSLDGVSTIAIVTKLFRTTVKRVRANLSDSGKYGDALQRVHKHDPNADMGDKLKELGRLMIELKRFRESDKYKEIEKDSKTRSVRMETSMQKKKQAESSTKGLGKKRKEDAFVYNEYGADWSIGGGAMEEMMANNDSLQEMYQSMDGKPSSKKQASDREDRYNKRRTRYGGVENNMVDEEVDEEAANAAEADAIRRGKFMGV